MQHVTKTHKSDWSARLGWPAVSAVGLGVMVALGGISGCQRNEAPPLVSVFAVEGRVLLANQKPLQAGRVLLVPTTQEPPLVATGTIGSDGRFTLTTGDSGSGAPIGDYKVRIEPDGPPPVVGSTPKRGRGALAFPPRYLDEDTSGLAVTVRAEANTLAPFVLK